MEVVFVRRNIYPSSANFTGDRLKLGDRFPCICKESFTDNVCNTAFGVDRTGCFSPCFLMLEIFVLVLRFAS